MYKINKKNKKENGYALLELLFYVSFFAVLSIVVINSMILMTKSFRETTLQAELLQSGGVMERLSREIRQANNITSISGSDLKLDTTYGAGVAKTVEFALSGTDIHFLENDILTGNLNTPNIVVTGLTFTQVTTTVGQAVKITLSVRSSNDSLNRVVDFYDTIALRGIY
ncbi:MAG: hypothetical protein V4699_03805 [Patescibacteria group bacterium]